MKKANTLNEKSKHAKKLQNWVLLQMCHMFKKFDLNNSWTI